MYGELQSPYQMCPNVTSFQVKNGYFSDTNLKLSVEMSAAAVKHDGTHYTIASDLTRYFNADDYNENGFLKSVQTSQQFDVFQKNMQTTMYKSISQTKINYYNFYFLDTSAISLIDFSSEFETY